MIKVLVGNSTSTITGLSDSQFKAVREMFSYTAKDSYYTGRSFGNGKKYLMSRRGTFATGLFYLAIEFLKTIEKGTKFEIEDTRVRPISKCDFKLNLGLIPHKFQVDAIQALADHDGRGIIVAPTGSGKSIVCAMAIHALGVSTLVVVPTLALKTQLTADLRKFFGETWVGSIKDKCFIAVENVDALDPEVPSTCNAVIIDEYHTSASSRYQKLNLKAWKNVYARVGLTATPYRNKNEEKLLFESIISEVIYKLEHQDAVDKGYIVPLQVCTVELAKVKMKGNPTNWHSVNSELIVNGQERNETIVDLVQAFEAEGKSTLVLFAEIKHGEIVQEMLRARGLDIALADGKNPDNRMLLLEFNLRERKTLLATGVLGMGVDTKPCDVVILAAGGKSRPQLIQNIGRCLRVYPGKEMGMAIIFKDDSHKWLTKHYKEVKKIILDEYGIKL